MTFTIPGSGVNYVNVADETGIECPNGDVQAYAKALKLLADNKELRKKYGANAKKRVEEKFMYKNFEREIGNLI